MLDHEDAADVSAGLRENYRTRWKSAIAAVRASQKFMHAGERHKDRPDFTSPMYSDDEDSNTPSRDGSRGAHLPPDASLPALGAPLSDPTPGQGSVHAAPPIGESPEVLAPSRSPQDAAVSPLQTASAQPSASHHADAPASQRAPADGEPHGSPRKEEGWNAHSLMSKLQSMYTEK